MDSILRASNLIDVEELLEPVEAVVELPPATVIAPGPGPGPGAARDALRALGPPKLKLRTAAPPIDRANAARLLPVRLPPRVIIISGVGTRSERGCLLLSFAMLPRRRDRCMQQPAPRVLRGGVCTGCRRKKRTADADRSKRRSK